MLCGKGGVKWLDAKRRGVGGESCRGHQRDGAESSDVAVVERAAVVENELERGIAALLIRKGAGVDEQRAGEARLHHDALTRREIQNHELGSPPRARN